MTKMRELAQKATPGPWTTLNDSALDTLDHRYSGLALVETGRQSNWPIARLCEWSNAYFIAACSPERILAYEDCVEALRLFDSHASDCLSLHYDTSACDCGYAEARAALAALDALEEP